MWPRTKRFFVNKIIVKKKYKIYSIIKTEITSRKLKNVKYIKININNYKKFLIY